jgi:hypothetical protein
MLPREVLELVLAAAVPLGAPSVQMEVQHWLPGRHVPRGLLGTLARAAVGDVWAQLAHLEQPAAAVAGPAAAAAAVALAAQEAAAANAAAEAAMYALNLLLDQHVAAMGAGLPAAAGGAQQQQQPGARVPRDVLAAAQHAMQP